MIPDIIYHIIYHIYIYHIIYVYVYDYAYGYTYLYPYHISYHMMSCHISYITYIISHHITSHHIIYHIIYHTTPHHTTPHHITHHITSHHITSHQITSYHNTSYPIILQFDSVHGELRPYFDPKYCIMLLHIIYWNLINDVSVVFLHKPTNVFSIRKIKFKCFLGVLCKRKAWYQRGTVILI